MGINFPTVDDKAMYPRAKMKATFDQLWPSLFSMTQELEGVKIKGVNVIPKVILRKLTKDQIARLSNTVRIRRPGPRSRRFRKAVITSDSDSDGGSLPDSGEPTNFSYFSDDDDDEAEAALQNPSSRFGPSKENVGKEAVPKLNNEKNTSKSSDKVDQEILMRVTNLKDKEFLYNTDESSPNPVNSFIKALAEGTNSFSKSSERVHQKRNVNFDKAFDRVHREVISTGKGGHESRKESVLSSNKLNEKWASSSKSASTTHQAKEVWKKPLPKNDKSSPGNNSKENAVKASKTRSLSSANKLASQHSTTSSKSNNNLSGDKVSTSESTSKDVARTKLGNSSSTEAKEKHVSELKTKDGLKEMLDTKPRISEKRKSSEDETVFSHSEDKKGKKRKLSPARKAPPPNMVSVPSATIIEYVGLGKEIQIKKNLELSRGLKQPNVPKLKISTEPELRVSTEPALKASKEPALKASKEPALKALKEATLKASEEPAPKISTEPTLTISAASKSKASAEPPKVVIKEVVKKDDSLVSLPIMLVINTEEEKLSKETLDMKSIEDMKHVARTLSNILCKLKKHKLEVERELDDEVKKLKKKYDAKVEDVETNIKLYNEIDIELCSEIPKMYPGNELKTLNEELKSKIKDLFIHDMGEEEEQELKESTEDSVTTMQGNVPKSSQPTLVSTIKDLNVKDRSVREETRAQQSQSKESANPKQAIIRTIPEANVEYFGQKTKETKGAANVQHSTDVSRSKETSHQKPNESFGAKVQSPSLTMGTRVGHEVTLSKAQPTLRVDQTPIRHNSVSNPVSSSVIHIGPSTPTNSGVIHVRPSTPTNSGVIHVRPSAPTSSGVIHVRPSTPTSSTITPLRQHRAIASKQPILNPTTSVQTSHYTAIKPMSTMTSARPIQQHVSISPIVSHITNAQHIPNTQPQHIPNAQPQHIPNAQPQHITNAQPQHIPNTQQQHIPNTQQQQISNVLPQAAHVQPQQVGQVPVQSHLALLQPHIGNIQPQLQVSRLQSQQLLITHSQQQIPQLQQVSQIQTSQPQQQFPLLLQQQPPSYHQAINQQQPQHQTYQISTQQQQQQQQQQHQTYQINTQPQQQLQQQQQPQLQQQQQQQQQQQPVYQQQSTYQPQMQYSHQYQISSNLTPQAHVDEHGNVVMKNIPMASKQQDEPQNKNQNSSLLKQILGEKSRPNLSASVQQQPSVSVSNQMFPIITSAISLARGNSPSPDLQTSEDIIDLSAKTCFLCGVEATILCCGQFVYCGPACKESDRDRHKQECRSKN